MRINEFNFSLLTVPRLPTVARPRSRHRTWLTLVACLIAALGVVFFVIANLSGNPDRTGVTKGDKWTHREMCEHLRSRGLPYEMTPSRKAILAYLHEPHVVNAGEIGDELPSRLYDGIVCFLKVPPDPVSKETGEEIASKRVRARQPDPHMFNWGPWVFRGDAQMLEQIRSALEE